MSGKKPAAFESSFPLKVLALVAREDQHDAIWWRTDGEFAPVTFWVHCSDLFSWGTADLEPLEEGDLGMLKQAFADCRRLTGTNLYGPELYCARRRGLRPQGAAYPKDKELWPLFDACGPERDLGLGNPHGHPGEKQDV